MTQLQHSDYEYDVDINGYSAAAHVIRMVGKNKHVLELGAGPGSITKHLFREGKCRIKAIEANPDSIIKLKTYCELVYQADLNNTNWQELLDKNDKYDVIVAADVLEHLYNPWEILTVMKKLIKNDGYLVISLPHVGHSAVIACLLNEDFEYQDWGLLDRTHVRFFGLNNIQFLFDNAGLSIEDAQFVVIPPDQTEFSAQWKKLSLATRRILSSYKYGLIYQVVIKAVPKERMNNGISLMSLVVQKPAISLKHKLKTIVRPFIPQKMRIMLHHMLNNFIHRKQ